MFWPSPFLSISERTLLLFCILSKNRDICKNKPKKISGNSSIGELGKKIKNVGQNI